MATFNPDLVLTGRYHINHATARGLNEVTHFRPNKSADGRLGDKLVNLQQKAVITNSGATQGVDADGKTKNKFTFTKIGLFPPQGGRHQVDVQIDDLKLRYDQYTVYVDKGIYASSSTQQNPTKAASYVTILLNLSGGEKIEFKRF